MKNKIHRRHSLDRNSQFKTRAGDFISMYFNIWTVIELIGIVAIMTLWVVLIFENNTLKQLPKKDIAITLSSKVEKQVEVKLLDKKEIFKVEVTEKEEKLSENKAQTSSQEEQSDKIEETFNREEKTKKIKVDNHSTKTNNTIKETNAYTIKEISAICQLPELPTGCEATALTTLMNFKGIKVDKYQIAMEYMPKQELFFKDGILYGPNPVRVFVGNPAENSGLGCFAPCLVQTFKNYVKNNKEQEGIFQAVDLTGTEFSIILQDYVAKDNPVVVIVSQNLWTPYEGTTWQLQYGGTWTWMVNHHAMVVYGFNRQRNEVYVCDPLSSTGIATYDLSKFEEIYSLKGKSAMTITEKGI